MGAAPLLGITLFLSLSSLSLPVLSSFAPTTSFFLSCGSTSTITLSADNPARNFTPDSKFLTTSDSIPLANPETPSSPLYAAARAFTASSTYQFSVGSHGTHVLRLHFLPFFASGHDLSAAHFTVSVSAPQGVVLLRDFPVAPFAGPEVKEFFVSVDSDRLLLTFDPAADGLAFVNAVEFFTAPSNLLNGSETHHVGETIADGFPQQPMETVYRINVGGPLVTPANDTLWRTWSLDDKYLHTPSLALRNSTELRNVNYDTSPLVTPEIAPASVYSTARTMNVPPEMRQGNPNFNFNVTWQFPVFAGGEYFVRMHFCDFVSQSATELYFDVYLGGLMAYPDLQPGSFTGQTPAGAFFVDFAVTAHSDVLNVSIGRSSQSTPLNANAILNGLEIMRSINLGSTGSGGNDKKKISTLVLIVLILGGLILIAALIIVLIFVCKRCRLSKPVSESKETNSVLWSPFRGSANSVSLTGKSTSGTTPGTTPRTNLGLHISFAEIKLATENFNDQNLIGSGGFGKVYKGVLTDGTRVAVKRGQPQSRQGYPEFQTEILLLSRIRHRHLVSLIGYCEEHSEMLLVYEFMEKGPLKSHLYGTDLPCLSWKQRLQICIGAARGLHYLHTGDAQSIIHRDVKSSNILLGEDYVAKVSDFGLSKVGPSYGESHVSTAVKGSFGYLDPEYFKTQKLTDKSDVYSFGVVLLEVLCARPVINPLMSREQISLSEWALSWLRRGQVDKIIDQRLAGKINANSLRKFGETAVKCLAEYGRERPCIGDVLWNLEYALHLQETELHREPYEDSGNVESQIPVAAVRRAPSTSLGIEQEEEDGERGSESQSDVTESKVFSQLVTGEGR